MNNRDTEAEANQVVIALAAFLLGELRSDAGPGGALGYASIVRAPRPEELWANREDEGE